MAIVDARILRTLQLSETKEKQAVKLSATQDFLVISDTKNPAFADILANTATFANLSGAALPQIDDVVTVNGVSLKVASRKLQWHDGSDRVVHMAVSYEGFDDEAEEPDPPDGDSEPTWRRISVRTQQMTRPAVVYNSQAESHIDNPAGDFPARNSAGDPIDGLEEDVACVAYTYTNPNVRNPNFSSLNAYVNTCNSNNFLSNVAYTVRCTGWSGEFDEKAQTWSISIEFLMNPYGWYFQVIDAGFNEIVNGERRAIVDSRGNPVSTPVPLDGNGQALIAGYGDGNLNVLTFYPYVSRDLNSIWADCNI